MNQRYHTRIRSVCLGQWTLKIHTLRICLKYYVKDPSAGAAWEIKRKDGREGDQFDETDFPGESIQLGIICIEILLKTNPSWDNP